MAGFTKLFSTIVTSTIWLESPATKVVWITMLALCDRDGIVEGSVPGLAHQSGVTLEEAQTAIARFMAPDTYSRTKEHDGRRIAEIDGGWRLLNYERYREKSSPEDVKEKNRLRQQRFRDKRNGVTTVTNHGNNHIAEVEAEAEAEAGKSTSERDSARNSEMLPDVETRLLKLANAHPKGETYRAFTELPQQLVTAMIDAIESELSGPPETEPTREQAYQQILNRTMQYRMAVARWPKEERRYAANLVEWFTKFQYRNDPAEWERQDGTAKPGPGNSSPTINRTAQRTDSAVTQLQRAVQAERADEARAGDGSGNTPVGSPRAATGCRAPEDLRGPARGFGIGRAPNGFRTR